MKTVEEYMKMPFRMEIVKDEDEGGYVVSCEELPGCLTCGETISAAVENFEAAKRVWFEAALEDGIEISEPKSVNEYSGQFKIRIAKSLHKALAEQARKEGISMNQYCAYLLAANHAVNHQKQLLK